MTFLLSRYNLFSTLSRDVLIRFLSVIDFPTFFPFLLAMIDNPFRVIFRLCRDGVKKPASKTTECSILERSIGAAMKDFKVGVTVVQVTERVQPPIALL